MLKLILTELWRALWNWILKREAKPMSDPLISVSGSSDIGAIAGAVSDAEKLATAVITAEDSPAMIAARYNVSLQAAKDAIAAHNREALKTGDVTKVDQDLS